MKLAVVKVRDLEKVCVCTSIGLVPMDSINRRFKRNLPSGMLSLIQTGNFEQLIEWYRSGGREKLETMEDEAIRTDKAQFAPLYRQPQKIWGIGLNYSAHASDLSVKVPTVTPASFMRPDTSIIGYGDYIKIPIQSEKTTAEAELGIVIGKKCKSVEPKDWLSVVAGFVAILDMTAEDILRQNPRYLTMSKSYDTFFSLGPYLVTPDEIDNVPNLEVATVINGKVHAQNLVSNMIFSPAYLVSFHSKIMTMLPGDIISTGTPGAVSLQDGDTVECRITGFEPLVNPVTDLKNIKLEGE